MVKLYLKRKRDEAVKRFHPWIFSGAIGRLDGTPKDGDQVEVVSHDGEFLAIAHYQAGASICARIFSYEKTTADYPFWLKRLRQAFDYRQKIGLLGKPNTTCYRLVHAEGDGLPGLIIDVYEKNAVVQCHSVGMHLHIETIAEALIEAGAGHVLSIFDKSRETLPAEYASNVVNRYVRGESLPQVVQENGHFFYVDWELGQKTGFFVDQRDNRQLLAAYAKGRSILNTFCYSGGFSVYALAAGASLVHSVDASAKAVEWTRNNIEINQFDPDIHLAFAADVQHYLKSCQHYDLVVVDPPAFAKSLSKRHNAVQGYKRLNEAALKKIAPGGILFTFSCSQVIDRELFYNTIVAAAMEAGRQVRVMHHLSQPADHPVSLFHPEGAYLKGLVLYVE